MGAPAETWPQDPAQAIEALHREYWRMCVVIADRIVHDDCCAVDHLRRGRRHRHEMLTETSRLAAMPDAEAQAIDELAAGELMRAVDAVPAPYGPALRLFVEGYHYPDIARMLGIPQSTVRGRLNRARSALRKATGNGEKRPQRGAISCNRSGWSA